MKDLNRLKVVLVEQKKTGKWLVEQLGKSFSIVNAYACNRRQPSLEQLFEIAKILQVEPKELIANK
jgi:transcriptional regulator with XRE-family HTH domain